MRGLRVETVRVAETPTGADPLCGLGRCGIVRVMDQIEDLLQLASRVKDLRDQLREAEARLHAYVSRRPQPSDRTTPTPTKKTKTKTRRRATASKARTAHVAQSKTGIADQIRRYVETHPGASFQVASLMAALKLPRKSGGAVRTALRNLHIDGTVTRSARGVYRLKAKK